MTNEYNGNLEVSDSKFEGNNGTLFYLAPVNQDNFRNPLSMKASNITVSKCFAG